MARLNTKGQLLIPEDLIICTDLADVNELNLWYDARRDFFNLDVKRIDKAYELIGTVRIKSRRFFLSKSIRDLFNITQDSKILFFIKDAQLFFRVL